MTLLSFASPIRDLDSERLAISLVIDTSGSMEDTDPQRLRESVTNSFIDHLNPDDYLGIITFNSHVDLVIAPEKLENDTIRDEMKEILANKLEDAGNTDYTSALEEANDSLQLLNEDNLTKIIIFLTDGEPYPGPRYLRDNDMDSYMNELWQVVSDIGDNDYPVYSIGFTDEIDIDVLNRMANETDGDVRIYEDANDLDENLVSLLLSREEIVEELLEIERVSSQIDGQPVLVSDFWFSQGGYRLGESTVVTGSVMIANSRISSGGSLIIDSFQLITEDEDGDIRNIDLYDDGTQIHGDIRADDGLYSNRMTFNRPGTYNARLSMTGSFNGEDLSLDKDLGQFRVAQPGTVSLSQDGQSLSVTRGDSLSIPLIIDNDSEFEERIFLSIDEDIGQLSNNQLDLEANWQGQYDLRVVLDPDLSLGNHKINILAEAREESTTIEINALEYDFELVGRWQGLWTGFLQGSSPILLIISLIIGLALIIFLLGLFLYFLLVKPKLKVKGTLLYWKENESQSEIDLSSMKKNKISISFDDEGVFDYSIGNSPYSYKLIVYKEGLEKGLKFILGWKTLLRRASSPDLIIETSQPGIIEHDNQIRTKMNLYDGNEFISGDYHFRYINRNEEGKNVLEGKI